MKKNQSKTVSAKNIAAKGKTSGNTAEKKQTNKFLLIFICIFVSLALLLGIVLGTIALVKSANAVVEYKGVRMSASVANYFASYSKAYYMRLLSSSGVEVEDTEEFWNSHDIGTRTYGDSLREYVEITIREIVVGCALFDAYSSLTSAEKAAIKDNAAQRLLYIAEGDTKEFNKLTKPYGFDFSDFEEATEMMYKAKYAQYAIYGSGGSALTSNIDEANEYFSNNYTRVKLLFIRTEDDFLLDESGEKRQLDDEGNEIIESLTAAEREERQNDIEAIRTAIENYVEDENNAMSPVTFDSYLEKYKATNLYLDSAGEYYSWSADYTARAYEELPDVVTAAMDLMIGDYAEVETDFGVCFLYCDELISGAYADTAEDGPFSDFYSDLASYLYGLDLEELALEVIIKDKFNELDLIALPANGMYTIGI